MSAPLLELRDVFCVHRTDEGDAAALQGTTFAAQEREIVCVLGPSGAGKSTMLRVIAGLETPSAGVVNVIGQDIGRLSDRARARLRHTEIGFLGQHPESVLPPDLRIADAVGLPLALRGATPEAERTRARALLGAAGLEQRLDALPSELSGGERQRVALCAALAHRPKVLLADEPTGELDAAAADAVRGLIAELARADGATVIMVSHDPESATIADRAVHIRDGRIVEDHRNGSHAFLVAPGGWLQLPRTMLAQAGIGERVSARVVPGGLIVTPADGDPGAPTAPAPMRDRAPLGRGRWEAARVELRDVSRTRGRGAAKRSVLSDLTLAFAPGRMTVVTGRSGSGKTTLLRLLGGLDSPDDGQVLIDDRRLDQGDAEARAALRRERIGYLPQQPSPVGFLSAHENVVLSLRLRGWDADGAGERAAIVLAHVGLADRARQRVERLSAGEGQRVALARALASARGLLIVDEPTSRLDEANAGAVAEMLAAAAAEDGQTVVCATHDPEVIRHADATIAL